MDADGERDDEGDSDGDALAEADLDGDSEADDVALADAEADRGAWPGAVASISSRPENRGEIVVSGIDPVVLSPTQENSTFRMFPNALWDCVTVPAMRLA